MNFAKDLLKRMKEANSNLNRIRGQTTLESELRKKYDLG